MVDKPEQFPEWAKEEIINDTSGQLNRVEPPDPVKDEGWRRREIPPRQWWNWLANKVYLWTLWFEDQIENFCVRDETSMPAFLVRAWGNFDGSSFDGSGNIQTIRGSGNIASIVRVSEGLYRVSFQEPMSDSGYAVVASVSQNTGSPGSLPDGANVFNISSDSFDIQGSNRLDETLPNGDQAVVTFQVVR